MVGSSALTERITTPTITPSALAAAKFLSVKMLNGRNGFALVNECTSENQSATKATDASNTISAESNQPWLWPRSNTSCTAAIASASSEKPTMSNLRDRSGGVSGMNV